MSLPKLLVIVGPTASGKSALAIALAKKLNGEIISADSRQFYRGMAIGSGVVEGEWQKNGRRRVYDAEGIPHYFLLLRSPAKPLTVAEFQKMAIAKAGEISAHGKLPILVGGTGLYVRSVVDNFQIPRVAPNLSLRKKLAKKTTKQLYAMLKKKDPVYATKISSANRRYMSRALEVIATTGSPFTKQQIMGAPLFDVLQISPAVPREKLYKKIDDRVESMMDAGLLAEAKRLGTRYGWKTQTLSGLGHRHLGLFLQGKISCDEAVRLFKRDTRHYAKRQIGWFRRDTRIRSSKTTGSALCMIKDWLK